MISPEKITMMEDHDEALRAWKARGVRSGTLVHVDAHIDFGWIPEMDFDEIGSAGIDPRRPDGEGPLLNPFISSRKKMVNIGNYICPALRDGLVDKFYWVVPDESWRSARGKRHIVKYLRRLLSIKQYASGRIEYYPRHMRACIFGKEVIVCSLDGLKRIDAPALLDIDVDFMVTKHIWNDLDPARAPWISSGELYERLGRKIGDIEALTISYSVEGGFTPLRFKYLGDELRMLYAGTALPGKREVMKLKKDALLMWNKGRYKEAAAIYDTALGIDGQDASLCFNLSLCYQSGPAADTKKAADFYREAVSLDKTYSTRFNNHGILLLQRGEFRKAGESFERVLQFDGMKAAALCGLGHAALGRKKYGEALALFKECLGVDAGYFGARFGAAIANFKSGRLEEARALFLGLNKNTPEDPEISWWLGRIAEKDGEYPAAIDHYKRSVMLGREEAAAHLRLSRLYVKTGLYFRVFEELGRAVKLMRKC